MTWTKVGKYRLIYFLTFVSTNLLERTSTFIHNRKFQTLFTPDVNFINFSGKGIAWRMHRFVFADWANQRPNPSASLVVPAVHMTNHMWSHWSSACRLMLHFGVSRIYMLGNGIHQLLYAKLFLLWTSEVHSDNCWSLICTETELGASSLLRWMDLCSFQFSRAAYCTSVGCLYLQLTPALWPRFM